MNKKKKISISVLVIAAIALTVMVNVFVSVLASRVSLKADFTSNKMYALSDVTKEFLKTYDTDTEIYILASEADQDERISSVLAQYAGANGKIHVTNINMAENPTFGKKYVTDGSSLAANSVIVDGGERFKLFSMTELYGLDAQSGLYTSLNVENKINSALKYISLDTQLKAYFITGHNEMAATGAVTKLKDENYETVEWNTLTEDTPSDASLVMLVRPTADFSEAEIAKIDAYLAGGGALQCYFDVDSRALTNLFGYLAKTWGIGVNDNVVIETDMTQAVALGRSGVALVVPLTMSTEFTDSIIKNKRTIAYYPYSKSLTRAFEENGAVKVREILTSSDKSYTTANDTIDRTGGEVDGKFTVAALSEDTAHNSSVYVSGNTALLTIAPSTLTNDYGLANYDYFMNLTGYMTGSESTFLAGEKTLVNNVISITPMTSVIAFALCVVIIPLAVLICGIVVWIKRRNL